MIDNVWDVFLRFCAFQRILRLFCILLVLHKQTLSEMGNQIIIRWQVVLEIFTPEIIEFW